MFFSILLATWNVPHENLNVLGGALDAPALVAKIEPPNSTANVNVAQPMTHSDRENL
jgi:hypothetical protein